VVSIQTGFTFIVYPASSYFSSASRTQVSSQGSSSHGRRAHPSGPGLNQLAQGGIKPEAQLDYLRGTF
jgi:hypothetical protein